MALFRTPDGRLWSTDGKPVRQSFSFGAERDDDDDDEYDVDDLLVFGADLYGKAKRAAARGDSAKIARLRKQALARAAGGFSMPDKGDGYGLRLPLGFSQVIPAGQSATVPLQPQNRIRVEEVVLASPNAQLFDLISLKVGTEDQFVASGPINGDILSSQCMRKVSFKGSVADPGIVIFATFQNLDPDNAQTVKGAVLGPVVRYGQGVAG